MNDAKCDRYIENLRKVRAFAKPEVRPGMGAQELLDLIQKNAAESFAIMKENNALLDELVYTRKAEELTDEDIAQLLRFADRLFARSTACCWKRPACAKTNPSSSGNSTTAA